MNKQISVYLCLCLLGFVPPVRAQFDFEKAPINYGTTESKDAVAQLKQRIDAGTIQLEYDTKLGWLPSLLKHLDIDAQSQVLVFSKTSLQLQKISPRTPRAIYFNDDVYVGFCQQGDLLEIAATDPHLGAVFYSIDQTEGQPTIVADRGQCLTCHATNRTQGIPGYLVRSVYADFSGRPRSGTRTYVTDHTTEFDKRFGGWYVTGQHGDLRHLGNTIAADRTDPEKVDIEAGANHQDLSSFFNVQNYLTPHSDLVALMLLEHQSQMHNLLARASMETRSALYHDSGINQALGRPAETMSESTQRRIQRAAEDVVRYMLFADEHPLAHPVSGNTPYAAIFQARAEQGQQRDSLGRSLRDLDLQTRMFKYPCSYLIYSEAFQQLPTPVYQQVCRKLHEVLTVEETVSGFERLAATDRQAILEILDETLPGLFSGIQSGAELSDGG